MFAAAENGPRHRHPAACPPLISQPPALRTDGVALRATTNPAAWRIACRRFAAVGLATGLDFVGRRKASASTLRVSPCRRTRKTAFAVHENARFAGFTKRNHDPARYAFATHAHYAGFTKRNHDQSRLHCTRQLRGLHERNTGNGKVRIGVETDFVKFCAPRRRRFVSRRGEEARRGGVDAPTPARHLRSA